MWFLTSLLICTNFGLIFAAGQIANQKCVEYSKYVYTMEDSPVLLRRSNKNKVSQCGMVEVPLVIGGVKSLPKEFPHMAVIGYGQSINDPNIAWRCGGTLISENFVITAAHCFNDIQNAVKVRLGEVDFTTDDDSIIQDRGIIEKIIHPDYNPELKYNDLALLKLDEPVEFTAFVRPACLNTNKQLQPFAIASGFGKTAYDASEGSKFLMKVTLNIISNNECTKYFSNEIKGGTLINGITDNVICAGYLLGGRDTCQGDSGGPLQLALSIPYCMYSIIGVVSFGKFCGFANMPAIYTAVSEFIPWIEKIVWK